MNTTDGIKATGELRIQHWDEFGNVKEDRTVPNLVVTVGKNHIAGRLANSPTPPTAMGWMAVGTATTNLVVANTTLAAEGATARVALTSAISSTNVVTYIATFPPGSGTGALVEAGIFNATGQNLGVMLSRTIFSVINKEALDSISITWTLTIN